MAGYTFDERLRRGYPIVIVVTLILTIIEMCITAFLVGQYNKHDNYPNDSIRDKIRFMLFAAIWTLFLTVVYSIGFVRGTASFLFSIASHAVFFFITWLFWLIGTASLTKALGGGLSCGSTNIIHCDQLNATIAFGWIIWVLFTFVLGIVSWKGSKSARDGDGFGGGLIPV